MTLDTNELRRKVNSTDIVDHIDLHANIKPFLSELIDRLETAEQTAQDYLRIDREKAQIAQRLEAAEKESALKERLLDARGSSLNAVSNERDALRTALEKIESAAQNLVNMKGRHNTEIAYQRLVAALEESK